MAKKKRGDCMLPLSTLVDVYAKKGDTVIKKEMEYGQYLEMQRKKGWRYDAFQKDFCTIKPTE